MGQGLRGQLLPPGGFTHSEPGEPEEVVIVTADRERIQSAGAGRNEDEARIFAIERLQVLE